MLIKESYLRKIIKDVILKEHQKLSEAVIGTGKTISEKEKLSKIKEIAKLCKKSEYIPLPKGYTRSKEYDDVLFEIQAKVDELMTMKDISGRRISFDEVEFLTLKQLNPGQYRDYEDYEDWSMNRPYVYDDNYFTPRIPVKHLMRDQISLDSPYTHLPKTEYSEEDYKNQKPYIAKNPFEFSPEGDLYITNPETGRRQAVTAHNDSPETFDIDDPKHKFSSWFKSLYKKYVEPNKDKNVIKFMPKNKK